MNKQICLLLGIMLELVNEQKQACYALLTEIIITNIILLLFRCIYTVFTVAGIML